MYYWLIFKSESIVYSFLKAGINFKSEGGEDESWEFPKNIIDNYI